MRASRRSTRAPSLCLLTAASCGVILTALVTPASASTGDVAEAQPSPAGRVSAGLSLSVGSTKSPQPVAPTVQDREIPAVAAGKRAETARMDGLPTGRGRLEAHVVRPVVHAFSMIAVTWNQTRDVANLRLEVRTRSRGHWGSWSALAVDGDGPTAQEDSVARAGTSPLWVGHATGVEVAVYGVRLRGLKVDTIDPGTSPHDTMLATAAVATSTEPSRTFPSMPRIVTRAQWGADESLGDACWAPKYGNTFKAVVVHHTAGSNTYSQSEAPEVVRGVLAYHTISRGWCDIGYNFLIDRYGTIYEGRAGGILQPVRGAHAGDYNINTTGISLMGNFDIAHTTQTMKNALVRLVTWRLGTAYHSAYGRPFLHDGLFNRISGHRDVMETACPGRYAYDWIPTLRARVQARLGDWRSRIELAWRAAGGSHSPLGAVRVGEQMGNGGHHTTFDDGRMYFGHKGVFTFYRGPVLAAYVRSGETGGGLGYPVSNVFVTAGSGHSAVFVNGRIYSSQAAGTHPMRRGAILRRYVHLGGPASSLGLPVGSIHPIDGGTRDAFEDGLISYYAATRTTKVTIR